MTECLSGVSVPPQVEEHSGIRGLSTSAGLWFYRNHSDVVGCPYDRIIATDEHGLVEGQAR